jgi:hypothetical protein
VTPNVSRTRLKAAVWDAMATSNRCGPGCSACTANVAHAIAAAESYAVAIAEQTIDRMTPEQLRARLRLAEAASETGARR